MGGNGSLGDGVVDARLMATGYWGWGRLDVCSVNLETSAETEVVAPDAHGVVGDFGMGLMLCERETSSFVKIDFSMGTMVCS